MLDRTEQHAIAVNDQWRMALRLSRLFSNSPEFWLNAQRALDLWDAAKAIKAQVEKIKPLKVA
jgi:plasmid maintenance system antidote protein VapI